MKPSLLVAIASLPACILASAAHAEEITTDIWVDNWFAMHANGELVLEDSVPITTERSFNKESTTFSVTLPAVIAIEAKDFKENDSGLEYIGSRRQQMGDGGIIAQFREAASGDIVGVTDDNMKCLVVHHAPVDASCADLRDPIAGEGPCAFETVDIPDGWTSADFDDSNWPAAVVHSARDVSPKMGYDEVRWDDSAELVWGEDLKLDNTLLCRMTIGE